MNRNGFALAFGALLILAGMTIVGVFAWRLFDAAASDPNLARYLGGALLFGAGGLTVGALIVVAQAVDAFGDAAAAFGATVGHNRTRESQILDTAAGLRERNAKASYTEAQALGALPPIYTNGNGKATEEVWTG